MKHRLLSWILALAVLATMLAPMAALAEEPITLQWYYTNDTAVPLDNDFLLKEIEEAFNVKLELIGRPGPDQNAWYQRELAAGTKLDVYEGGGLQIGNYKQYVEDGLVMELDEAMIRENMPNLMAYYDKYADAFGGNIFDWYRIDGKIYTIPQARPGDAKRNVIGIRGDWLEELGLEMPKTIEEFEAVLDAFTYGDPDGNGEDDTYGFTGVNWNQFSMSPIAQAFGVNMDTWYLNDEGKVVYGNVQPEMKQFLEVLSRWYKAGYFPTEFWTQDWDAFRSQMTSGVAGMCVQSFDAFLLEDGGWAIGDLLLTNPDAWFEVSPGMVGPDGDYGCLQFNPVTFGGTMFSYELENQPEKLKKYMQVMDAILFSGDWLAKALYGEEGVGYNVNEKGEYVSTGAGEGTPAGHAIVQLREFYNDPEFDNSMNSVNNPEYYAKATKAFEAATGIYDVTSSLVGDRPLSKQYSQALNAIINNYLPQIISGERPIDDFDRMVEEWNAAGGLEVTAELQALLDK